MYLFIYLFIIFNFFHLSLIFVLHCPFYMLNHMLSMKCQEKTMTCCHFTTANSKEFETETGIIRLLCLFPSVFQVTVCGCKDRKRSSTQHIVQGVRVGGLSDLNADWLSVTGKCKQIKESFVRFQCNLAANQEMQSICI